MKGYCNSCNNPCRPQDNYCFECRIRLDRIEPEPQLIRGVRYYQIMVEQEFDILDRVPYWMVTLQGAFGVTWRTRDMKFKCRMFGQKNNTNEDLFECIDRGHGCGIYVLRDGDYSYAGYATRADVKAYVLAWGQVAEYERGWRASNVRIERIVLDSRHTPKLCGYLLERYQVPIDCKFSHLLERERPFGLPGQPYYYTR